MDAYNTQPTQLEPPVKVAQGVEFTGSCEFCCVRIVAVDAHPAVAAVNYTEALNAHHERCERKKRYERESAQMAAAGRKMANDQMRGEE